MPNPEIEVIETALWIGTESPVISVDELFDLPLDRYNLVVERFRAMVKKIAAAQGGQGG